MNCTVKNEKFFRQPGREGCARGETVCRGQVVQNRLFQGWREVSLQGSSRRGAWQSGQEPDPEAP